MQSMKINATHARKSWILLYFLLPLLSRCQTLQFKPSPCPGTFSYDETNDDNDRWYGDIDLKVNHTIEDPIFRLTLDKPSQLLVSWTALATTTDNRVYSAYYSNTTLFRGSSYNDKIMVKFDKRKAIPMLESIHLSGVRICPLDPAVFTSESQTSAPRPDLPNSKAPDVDRKPTTKPQKSSSSGSVTRPSQTSNANSAGNSNSGTWNQGTTSRPGGSHSSTKIDSYGANSNSKPVTKVTTSRPTSTTSRANIDSYNNGHSADTGSWNQVNAKPTNSHNGASSGGSWSEDNSKPSGAIHAQEGSSSNSNYWNANPNSANSGDSHSSNSHSSGHGDGGTFHAGNSGSPNTGGSIVSCGTVSTANPLITNGKKTHPGQWPWHVALYKTEGIDLSYLCGGSLVARNKVITAAHCLVSNPGNKIINFKSLVVYLGKYNLRQYTDETGIQTKEVSSLNINPAYNSSNFQGDIAILTLSSDVEYTNYVRPVCIWEAADGIEDIVNKEGTVAGWGLTEYDQTSEVLKMATLPVVSTSTCIRSHPKFYAEYLSETAFCAGFSNGTSPCNGDSGGGLVFKRNGSWYLRGIVSLSVAKEGLNFCDPNYYVIFTDTARYSDFIKRNSL